MARQGTRLPGCVALFIDRAGPISVSVTKRLLQTPDTPADKMPFGAGLASGPTLQPAIYDPEAPVGKRWSNDGLEASSIARMYHSSALLLPGPCLRPRRYP